MKPHKPDLLSLTFGAVFLAVALIALGNPDGVAWSSVGGVAPVVLIILGVGVAVAALRER